MGENNNKDWCFCVTGNIVKTRIDQNGTLRYGTAAFTGGTKVYIQGRYWAEYYRNKGEISVIGLSRGKRYECLEVPVEAIENVRFQRVFHPKVVSMMEYFEFESCWWHRTANDRREAKAFAEAWNKGMLKSVPDRESEKKDTVSESEPEKKQTIFDFFSSLFTKRE